MKKIINPWKGLEGYNCFGCAPNNEAGVRMEFYEDSEEIVSIWKPRPEYQGWIDTLHVVVRPFCWMKFVLGSYSVNCKQQE